MDKHELIPEINKSLGISLSHNASADTLQLQLSDYINGLIQNDFHKLIMLLYRIDISEHKLTQLLLDQPSDDAAAIITTLIIERESQKLVSRRQCHTGENNISEEEKW